MARVQLALNVADLDGAIDLAEWDIDISQECPS